MKKINEDRFKPLYKYRANNKHLITLLKKSELHFSSPIEFNDPFDSNLEISDASGKEEILENFNSVKSNDMSFENILKLSLIDDTVFDTVNSKVKEWFYGWAKSTTVCSFSKRAHDLLMWAHYSDCHKGVCLGFNPTILEAYLGKAYDINYTRSIPQINIYKDSGNSAIQFFCTKSSHWKYEKEVRFIQQQLGGFKFPKEALVQVIFGVNCNDTEKVKIMRLIEKCGYKNVEFLQSFIDRKYFRLLAQRIHLKNNQTENYKRS